MFRCRSTVLFFFSICVVVTYYSQLPSSPNPENRQFWGGSARPPDMLLHSNRNDGSNVESHFDGAISVNLKLLTFIIIIIITLC